jgi:hypothetical protein
MRKDQFETTIMKLVSQFGARNFSQERINLIFDEVKYYSLLDFEQLVKHFIGNHRTAPTVQDFRKAVFDLNIKPIVKQTETSLKIVSGHGWVYPIELGVWADNRAIFIRTEKYPKFIMKFQCEDSELLEKDREAEKIWVTLFESLTDPSGPKYNSKEYHKIYSELLAKY